MRRRSEQGTGLITERHAISLAFFFRKGRGSGIATVHLRQRNGREATATYDTRTMAGFRGFIRRVVKRNVTKISQ